jgi:NADPH-dependent glutamate synthase beta subunit-like oxidoreductase
MRTLAIIGSGPAAFYTAEAALKAFGADGRIDILERLPTPYGLIRAGVAPDHQSIKAVSKRYDQVATDPRVRFLGDVEVGRDISVDELLALYDDVVLATGAPHDRPLSIPGDDLRGVLGAAAFVGWYNGHPDWAGLEPPLDGEDVVIVGNGNVAIDCARVLAKTADELAASDIAAHALAALARANTRTIRILGRRGPHQASFTLKEVGELGELARATPVVNAAEFPPEESDGLLESGRRRVVQLLRGFAAAGPDAAKPVRIHFDFFARPVRAMGETRIDWLEIMRTRLDADGRAQDTGETETIPCALLVSAIGYRTASVPGVPFDEAAGRFANSDGRIADRLWCVGWARRGPSGTIGTNRQDGIALVERIAATPHAGRGAGPAGLDRLLASRGVAPVDFCGWRRIDAAEVARAGGGRRRPAPRRRGRRARPRGRAAREAGGHRGAARRRAAGRRRLTATEAASISPPRSGE